MNLLILSTPRTGSNTLCQVLSLAGTMGHVDGYSVGWGPGLESTYTANDAAYRAKHGRNGHFAVKVMWDYLDHIRDHAKIPRFVPTWLEPWTHIIWLHREDRIAEAVSYFVALGSGKWTSENEQKRPWPKYDYYQIAAMLGMINAFNARTECLFQTHGKPAKLEMTYEQNAKDWGRAVQTVFDFVGLVPEQILPPKLQKQDNPLKAEYISQFRHDMVRARHGAI